MENSIWKDNSDINMNIFFKCTWADDTANEF